MGAKSAQKGQAAAQQEANQNAQISELQQAAVPPPPPAVDENDPLVKVQKLADLHAAGALTDEEFAAAKAKALGI